MSQELPEGAVRELIVQGGRKREIADADPSADLGRFSDLVEARAREEVVVETVRGAAVSRDARITGLDDDTIFEVELEGGITWWTTAADLAETLATAGDIGERAASEPLLDKTKKVLSIPPFVPFGARERGVGGLLVRALRRFDVKVAEAGAREIAERLESRLEPGPGLYRCPRPDDLRDPVGEAADLAGDLPYLLFLHGTASSTEGSFGDLAVDENRPAWERLTERYPGRILAFEHRTLSQGPAENTRDLVRLLPDNARLHLVSHSRGGLLGELLCRGGFGGDQSAFRQQELGMFAGDERRREREALRELDGLLTTKGIRVERFVRVACPARGTLLASRRLDRYLSLMLNALGLAVGGKANPTYQLLKALVIALAKTRANPEELPGLEAMMPGSPLIRLLNRTDRVTGADLSVIAGDIRGSGVFNRLKVFATDLFFRRDHDLVVDSKSMFGGARRSPGQARFFFETTKDTSHFSYFRNPSSSRLIAAALATDDREIDGFEPLEVGRAPAGVRGIQADGYVEPVDLDRLDKNRPVVVLLPGIMGSRLRLGDNVIWLDYSDLLLGRFPDLALRGNDQVSPAGLLERGYRDLAVFLTGSHEVVPFAYDWRRDIDRAADDLGSLLEDLHGRTEQPIRLVAHSMGGLVARRMRARHRATWNRLADRPGFRLLQLGTPNGGSHAISSILLKREKILRFLLLVGPNDRTREAIGGFTGLMQMLPPRQDSLVRDGKDLYDAATWRGWQGLDEDLYLPDAARLAEAKAFRAALDDDDGLDDDAVLYVAGQSHDGTPAALKEGKDRLGRPRLDLVLAAEGDGRVLWRDGIPAALARRGQVWYAPGIGHGDLAARDSLFPSLRELLLQGRTDTLPQTPPRTRGLPRTRVAEDEPVLLPDEGLFGAAALGLSPQPSRRGARRLRLRVSMAHGSLSFARGPVAVGHYERDLIVGAEGFLDSTLGGALSERHAMGLYPGPENTGEAILDPTDPHRGALIVGLGPIGNLTPAKITRGLRQAVLRYATQAAGCESAAGEGPEEPRKLVVSAVLIGTGIGTGLSVDDSLLATIEGVTGAMRMLQQVLGDDAPVIEHLEFVELYEHRAVCAAEALQKLAGYPRLRDDVELDIEPLLLTIEGGQDDIPCADAVWFRRLQIRRPDDAPDDPDRIQPLLFTSLTERARAEVKLLPTQQRLVERFVQSSIGSSAWRPEVAQTLFELLVPNELKSYAPNEQDLLLLVDRHAAHYPWELIVDGQGDTEPLSVRAGMLRQLASATYRERPVVPMDSTALVIGDPPTEDARYPPLPGARQEAEAVRRRLNGQGWTVRSEIGSRPEDVVTALFAHPYRLLHIAAHGEYDPTRPEASGVVLADGMLLTAGEVGQLRQVPELAFINCCHLGRIESLPVTTRGYRNRLAANLGLALIQIGVKAVVVAGWVVEDGAADTFAGTFYDAMLAGSTFGDAVKTARKTTYRNHPDTNTWGAYQCYGDPSFTLRKSRRPARSIDTTWVSPLKPRQRLTNIRSRARTGSQSTKLRTEIETIEEALVHRYPHWLQLGAVCEALGRAWAEIADLSAWTWRDGEGQRLAYRKAVEYLRKALTCEDGKVAVDVRNDLLNLEIRGDTVAWRLRRRERERVSRGGVEPPAELPDLTADTVALLEGHYRHLESYAGQAPTTRRWTFVGSAAKRWAAVGANRTDALDKAVDAYRRAYELSRMTCGRIDPYPAANWVMLKVVLRLADGNSKLDGVDEVIETLRSRREHATDFWDRVAPIQLELVDSFRRIYAGEEVSVESLLEALDGGRRVSSSHQLALLLESLDTLADILDERWSEPGDAGKKRLKSARSLVQQLRTWLLVRVGEDRR